MQNRLERAKTGLVVTKAGFLAVLVLVIGLPAGAQTTTCDNLGFPEANKVESNGATQISEPWGSAHWEGDEDTTLDVMINQGWTVEICIKAGGDGPQVYTVTEPQVIDVGQNGISHVSWRNATQTTTTSSSSTTSSTSTTTTTIGSQVEETSTTSTIEDEVLGTVITTSSTSTTIEDEVLDTEVLPFTGFGGAGFGLLALAIISAGLLFLVGGKSIER